MKAACYIRKGILEVIDVPMPQIQNPDDVLIKIQYTSICGSDVEKLYGKVFEKERPYSIMGHESCGTVIDLGPSARGSGLKIGDIVSGSPFHSCGVCHYCQSGHPEMCHKLKEMSGSMCEYVVWQRGNIVKIPAHISPKQATLTELTGTCLRAIERANIRQGGSVLILGAGGGGLILLQLALLSGAGIVAVMEPVASKRTIAKQLGADLVVDSGSIEGISQVSKLTHYRGYDTVIEASGDATMVSRGFNLLARGGTLLIYSKHGSNTSFNLYEFYIKEATVRTSYMGPYMFGHAVSIMPRLNLDSILSAEFDLQNAPDAFRAHLTGEHPRVVIKL